MRNPLIAGERIYLRPLEAADAEAFAQGAADEPETQMGRGRLPSSPIAFARWIGETYRESPSQSPTHIPLAVCLCADDRCIGSTTIRRIDWINRTAETGTGLLTGFRDQGYGTEAKFLLMEYAFDQLHLHALSSHVWEPNERSAAVLRKQGYRLAGRLKWHDIKDGVYRDELIFDILRPDFIAAREAWRGRWLIGPPSPPILGGAMALTPQPWGNDGPHPPAPSPGARERGSRRAKAGLP